VTKLSSPTSTFMLKINSWNQPKRSLNPTCTTDTVAVVNNLNVLESQIIDKNNSCTFLEPSHEKEVIANTSQDHAQKCIGNSISHIEKISETVVTTLTYDSDDNFSDTSDDTVYFKEEEGTNESSEEVSKKSEVVAKALEAQAKPLVSNEDNDNVYFDEVDDIVSSGSEEVSDPISRGFKFSEESHPPVLNNIVGGCVLRNNKHFRGNIFCVSLTNVNITKKIPGSFQNSVENSL
ncbi:62_t:CDS:2, partial [Funneliformis geosporum]